MGQYFFCNLLFKKDTIELQALTRVDSIVLTNTKTMWIPDSVPMTYKDI